VNLRPRFYVWPANLKVYCAGAPPGRLVYCSPRLVVTWHPQWRLEEWHVKGWAHSIRIGRLQVQCLGGVFAHRGRHES